MTFREKLDNAISTSNSLLCIGLDTDWQKLPEFMQRHENPVLEYNAALIEATKDLACCYKLNMAFYEAYGEAGMQAVEDALSRIPAHVLTIADVKRGDIGNTSDRYAYTYQEKYGFDASTINPLMGSDSVMPFLQREDRGVFFLGLTSNQGARDFEYLELKNGKLLYEEITDKVLEWNEAKDNCGLVVGATKPEELAALRKRAPRLPFLVPGIGAQGGSLEQTIEANGTGPALISVSRAIANASNKEDFAEAAREAAKKYVKDMRELSPSLKQSSVA